MHRLLIAVAVALISASCTGAAASPTPAPIPTPAPTPAPTTDLEPEPSLEGCPTAGAILDVNTFVGTDPACFGDRDVTIQGYEDVPEGIGGSDNGIEPAWLGTDLPQTSFLFQDERGFDCGEDSSCQNLTIHVDPASGLAFNDRARWVVVTGHRADPRSATCTYARSYAPDPTPPPAIDVCRGHFVLTAVRSARGYTWLGYCPTGAALSVYEFFQSDRTCSGSRDVSLYGWADAGGAPPEGPVVVPSWLAYPIAGSVNAIRHAAPVGGDEQGCGVDIACSSVFVHIRPGSGVTFPTKPGWVVATGHLADPASATCTYDSATGLDNEAARGFCRAQFVLTAVRSAAAPTPGGLGCPAASPLRLAAYLGAYPACFGSGDVRIVGWEDASSAFGAECPCITPDFLWGPQPMTLWHAQPTWSDGACIEACIGIYARINPASGLKFDVRGRWVIVTGHVRDAAAETCRWTDGSPAQTAIEACRAAFVITAVEPTGAPPS